MEKEYKRALSEHVYHTIKLSRYLLIVFSIVLEMFPTTSGYCLSISCMMMFGNGRRVLTS